VTSNTPPCHGHRGLDAFAELSAQYQMELVGICLVRHAW
jgi:hypothetical protein